MGAACGCADLGEDGAGRAGGRPKPLGLPRVLRGLVICVHPAMHPGKRSKAGGYARSTSPLCLKLICTTAASFIIPDPNLPQTLTDLVVRRQHQIFVCVRAKSLQLHPTLCDPMDCSLPGCSVHGVLQAGILECAANPFSRGYFPDPGIKPRSPTLQAVSLPSEPPGKPKWAPSFFSTSFFFKLC